MTPCTDEPDVTDVPIPTPEKGCDGWCFEIKKSKVKEASIDKVKFIETGRGCPDLMTSPPGFIIRRQIRSMLKDQLSSDDGFSIDSCSKGCACKDKKDYSGKTIRVKLKALRIDLDPANFKAPLNNFKKGECAVEVTGSAEIEVGKGWVGVCKKKKA